MGNVMNFTRRAFVAGATALSAPLILPSEAFAKTAKRTWSASRAGRDFGMQEVSVERTGSTAIVDFRTNLRGIILLIPIRYQLACREIWEGGVLQAVESKCIQNGEEFFVSGRRKGDSIELKSTKFNGLVDGNPGTSTFFVSDIIKRDVWISTQTGKPMKVASTNKGDTVIDIGGQKVACTHYYCGGQLRYPIDAYFDKDGELVAYFVDALGQQNKFIAQSMQPKLRPLWA